MSAIWLIVNQVWAAGGPEFLMVHVDPYLSWKVIVSCNFVPESQGRKISQVGDIISNDSTLLIDRRYYDCPQLKITSVRGFDRQRIELIVDLIMAAPTNYGKRVIHYDQGILTLYEALYSYREAKDIYEYLWGRRDTPYIKFRKLHVVQYPGEPLILK